MTDLNIETRMVATTTSIANGTHAAGTINGTGVDCKDAKEVKFQLYLHTDNGALTWKFQESDTLGGTYTDCLDLDGNVISTATDAIATVGTFLAKLLCERRKRFIRPVLIVTGTNMQGSCHGETYSPTNLSGPTVAASDGSYALVA